MKKIFLSLSAFFALVGLVWCIAPANAAKKTLAECQALAQQRGFIGGGSKMAGRPKTFIRNCMKGTQQ